MRKLRFFSLLLLGSCLVVLFLARGSHVSASAADPSTPLRAESNVPSVTTVCPTPGKARAAAMPALSPGSHPTIVYTANSPSTNGVPGLGTIIRYDVTTGRSAQIAQFATTALSLAQVSRDGQWVLLVAETTSQSKIQLIRMDGKYLQTLYCLPGGTTSGYGISGALWSPDQQYVVFLLPPASQTSSVTTIYLLTMQSGSLQVEASLDSGNAQVFFILRTWLDRTRVYLSDLPLLSVPTRLYLLDTSKGANQHLSDLAVVFHVRSGGTAGYFDFDRSADRTHLFLTQTAFDPNTGPFAPSTLSGQKALGGSQTTIYHSSTLVVENIRVISSTSLLLRVESSSDTSQNGLWKINADGTGLTRLTTELSGNEQSLGEMAQTPWSDISRDGSKYVLVNYNLQGKAPANSLLYGSLSGGSLTTFVSFTDGTNVNVAGWTTM